MFQHTTPDNMSDQVHNDPRRNLNKCGIGFAGVDGVWQRPACEAFELLEGIAQQLDAIEPALFAFIDAVGDLYRCGTSRRFRGLLEYEASARIPRLVGDGRVESLRPDFRLCTVAAGDSSNRLMATELEIYPSVHGFAHAMQSAYRLATDLAEGFARYLDGRPFLFVRTQAGSAFLFEQLSFCRALMDAGATGRVLYDLPLATLDEEVRRGERWQPPRFFIPYRRRGWNDDVIGRVRNHLLTMIGLWILMMPSSSVSATSIVLRPLGFVILISGIE